MFRTPIILIDDDQEYLDQLNSAFALSGQPCLPILFDRNNPQNETGIDHVIADTQHARIVALDINLRESQITQDAKSLYPTIERVLEKLNPIGPYYLIFWSRYKDLPGEIMRLLSSRSKDIFTPPIGWGFLDKTEFKSEESPGELKDKLIKVIDDKCVFRLLLEWEDRVAHAASFTLSELYKIASNSHDSGWRIEETKEKLITILTYIAHASVGHKNSKQDANYAVEAGLFPILEDNLKGITNGDFNEDLNNKWLNCLQKLGNNKLESLNDEEVSNLNSFYNIEEVHQSYSKSKRGVFVEIAEAVLKDGNSFSSIFGTQINNLTSLLKEEFLFKGTDEERGKIIGSSIVGWLEIGAACDHAHLKNKLHRYLLGILIPASHKDLLYSNSTRQDRAHEGIYRSPILNYKKNPYILFCSARYQIGIHPESDLLGIPLFRMKEQILNEIAFHWSIHSIRPGITSFR